MSEISKLGYEIAAKDAAWPVLPIIMADMQTGEILHVSKFAANIFGYEAEELVGQVIEVLVMDELKLPHAHWRKDASVPKTRLMGVGRQIYGKRKDGSTLPVHIGLTAMQALGRQVGIAFVIDLTGISQLSKANAVKE